MAYPHLARIDRVCTNCGGDLRSDPIRHNDSRSYAVGVVTVTEVCSTCGEVFTQSQIYEAVDNYNKLIQHASDVAEIIFKVNNKTTGITITPSFNITFEDNKVYAAYYWRNDEVIEFPVSYLWETKETIESLERQAIAEKQQRKIDADARREAKEQLDKDARDLALYQKLKEKFES